MRERSVVLRPGTPDDAPQVAAIWYAGWRDGAAVASRTNWWWRGRPSFHRGSGVAQRSLGAADAQVADNGLREAWLAAVASNLRPSCVQQRAAGHRASTPLHAACHRCPAEPCSFRLGCPLPVVIRLRRLPLI